jgi:hypothetical protein
MFETDPDGESLEDTLRSIFSELGQFVQRSIEDVDVDEVADSVGVDPDNARSWLDSATRWISSQTESLGEQLARRARSPRDAMVRADPLGRAAPHPLDAPTDEQGLALAALDSGRWIVEPGADALAARGEGPAPSNALGIVRELRVRDWIGADGELTLTGRHALRRWLDAAAPRRRSS